MVVITLPFSIPCVSYGTTWYHSGVAEVNTYRSQYLPSIRHWKETEAKRQAMNPGLCKEWCLPPGMAVTQDPCSLQLPLLGLLCALSYLPRLPRAPN